MKKSPERVTVPLVAERARIGVREVPTGGVRVTRRPRRETVVVDEPLRRDEVVVERVRVNRFVDETPEPRWEGETFVVPVVEEVAVVTRRLRLVEEVRLRRRSVEQRRPQEVTLRREEAVVERVRAPAGAGDRGRTQSRNTGRSRGGPRGESHGEDDRRDVRIAR